MKKLFFLSFLLIPTSSFADQFRKINLKTFNIIFPVQIKQEIPRFCSDIDYMYDAVFKDFKIKKNAKYKILITNTSIENGFVLPTFYRSQGSIFFINYNFLFSEYSTIFVHELRHLAQFSYFVKPFKEPFKHLSFATYDTAMLMEGDAVLTETLLTNEGRGRDPLFLLQEKTKILNDDKVSYASLLYHDHYKIGYLFCAHFRKKYGVANFRKLFERRNLYDGLSWKKGYKNFRIFVDNAIDRFYPLSINHRLKEITGKNVAQFFSEIKQDTKEYWNKQLENVKISKFEKVNKETNNYLNPQKFEDGIIALKVPHVESEGKAELNHYVFLKDGQEQWLKEFDFGSNVDFSYAQGKIVFHGSKSKQKNKKLPLHLKEADNAIYILDSKQGIVKVIDKFPHCQNPIFSHDASKIIFFSFKEDGTPTLIVLDSNDFNVLKKYELEKFHDYKSPIFSHDDKKIFFIDYFKGESRIKFIDEDKIKEVYQTKAILRGLCENKEFLFFGSPLSGIDNIYAFEKKSHQVWQVTSSKYGAYRPHIVDDALVYQDYNEKCYFDIAKVKIDKESWTPMEKVDDKNVYFFDGLQQQEKKVFTIENRDFCSYKAKKYRIYLKSKFFYRKDFLGSKKFSADPLQNLIYKKVYDTWIGLNFYDYCSGLSFGVKHKANSKSNLISANIGYSFFDIHDVNFETTVFSRTKEKMKFFKENILSYKPTFKTIVSKSVVTIEPEVQAIVKNKKQGLCFDFWCDLSFDTYNKSTQNTTFLAFNKFNGFIGHNFLYYLDKKNFFTFGVYAFSVAIDGIMKNSEMFKFLTQSKLTSCLMKINSEKIFIQNLKDLRQVGFSFGYKHLIPLEYSLENFNDEFYCLFVKNITVGSEIKVDIPMFDRKEYSLLCNLDIAVLQKTTIHTDFGIKYDENKISAIWPSLSVELNLI